MGAVEAARKAVKCMSDSSSKSDDSLKLVERLLNMFCALSSLYPYWPLKRLQILLLLKDEYHLSVSDVAKKVGMSMAAASRNIAILGRRGLHKEGLDLVDVFIDPDDDRRLNVALTNKGLQLIGYMQAVVSGQTEKERKFLDALLD